MRVLGELDTTPTFVSGYVVTPFVGWLAEVPELDPNPAEVAEILHVPLSRAGRRDPQGAGVQAWGPLVPHRGMGVERSRHLGSDRAHRPALPRDPGRGRAHRGPRTNVLVDGMVRHRNAHVSWSARRDSHSQPRRSFKLRRPALSRPSPRCVAIALALGAAILGYRIIRGGRGL